MRAGAATGESRRGAVRFLRRRPEKNCTRAPPRTVQKRRYLSPYPSLSNSIYKVPATRRVVAGFLASRAALLKN